MNLDYEALAAKDNPFEGLSEQQMDWMIVYLAFVREPVMTLEDIEFQWGMQLSADMPIFEAVRAADRIRYEIRCQKERPRRIKTALLVLGCAALILLGFIEFVRMPRVDQIRRFERETANAKWEAEAAVRKAEECRTDASNRIQTAKLDAEMRVRTAETNAQERIRSAEKDAQTRIQAAENGARARLNERIAGLVCAAQSGTIDASVAFERIKMMIVRMESPAVSSSSDVLSDLMERARRITSTANPSSDEAYACAMQLKGYLVKHSHREKPSKKVLQRGSDLFDIAKYVKHPDREEAWRLDAMDLMIKCFNMALAAGDGKAGFQLFLLYDGPSFCEKSDYAYSEPKLGISAELILAKNMDLAKAALIRACEMGDYDALSVALYLSEWRRKIWFETDDEWKYLCLLGEHANVKPEQMDRIARVFLGWSQDEGSNHYECGCKGTGWSSHDKDRHGKMKNNALHYFRQASARGNIDAKRWLIDNGYSFK